MHHEKTHGAKTTGLTQHDTGTCYQRYARPTPRHTRLKNSTRPVPARANDEPSPRENHDHIGKKNSGPENFVEAQGAFSRHRPVALSISRDHQ